MDGMIFVGIYILVLDYCMQAFIVIMPILVSAAVAVSVYTLLERTYERNRNRIRRL